MTHYCRQCRMDVTVDTRSARRPPVCPRCGWPLSLPLEPAQARGAGPSSAGTLPAIETLLCDPPSAPDAPPTPQALSFLRRIVDLSSELPPLAYGARKLDFDDADRTSAEAFLAQLKECRRRATDIVQRAVALQHEIDRYFDSLTYPPLPVEPPDMGIFNISERQRVARQCAAIQATRDSDQRMHDGLCTMLTTLWESLAKHLTVVDQTVQDVERMV